MTETFGRRKTDAMPADNDHDLLVRLDTKVTMIADNLSAFTKVVTESQKDLAERVARLEMKDSKDSGKFEAISVDVQRSLGNHEEIVKLQGEIKALSDKVDDLRKKANLFDYVNAALAVASGIVGSIFGSK